MVKLITSCLIVLSLQGCVFDEDAFDHNVSFTNDGEYVGYSRVDLEQRTGFFAIELTKPKRMEKQCTNSECSQTLFSYKGHYFDFSFIADGDWTTDLGALSEEETNLLLHTQVRQINGTFYFYQDFENTNPLLFKVEAEWPDFISGTSGNGLEGRYWPSCRCAFITLGLDEYTAYSSDGTEVSSDLTGSFKFEFRL